MQGKKKNQTNQPNNQTKKSQPNVFIKLSVLAKKLYNQYLDFWAPFAFGAVTSDLG